MAQKKFAHFKNGRLCRPTKCLLFFDEDAEMMRTVVLFTDNSAELLELNPQATIGWELPIKLEMFEGNHQKKEGHKLKMKEIFERQMKEDGYDLTDRNSSPPVYYCYNLKPN